MNQSRTLPFVGAALALALAAHAVATASDGLDPLGAAMLVVGVVLVLRTVRVALAAPAALVALRVVTGLGLVARALGERPSLTAAVVAPLSGALFAALLVELLATVPSRREGLRGVRALSWLLAAIAGAAGALGEMPPFELRGEVVLVSSRAVRDVVPLLLSIVLLGTFVGRARAARRAPTPDAAAAETWASVGLGIATLIAIVVVGLRTYAGEGLSWIADMRAPFAVATLAALHGHIAMLDEHRRLLAGQSVRRVVSSALALAAVVAAVAALSSAIPREPVTVAVVVALSAAFFVALERALAPLVRRALAPAGGRLLDAAPRVVDAAAGAGDLLALGRALDPLRALGGDPETAPRLFAFDPPRAIRFDAAGEPHLEERALSAPLFEALQRDEGAPVFAAQQKGREVRHPEVRPLVAALDELGADFVVPLYIDGELEGALSIPRGSRPRVPTFEELAAIRRIADGVGRRLSLISALSRAQDRAGEAWMARERAEEKLLAQEEELAHLRLQGRLQGLSRGVASQGDKPAAYGGASRAFEDALEAAADQATPVFIAAEHGCRAERSVRRLHGLGPRADAPFVVGDPLTVPRDELEAHLFGRDEEGERVPGWLRVARGGTLLLADLPALPLELQAQLVDALSARVARVAGGHTTHPLDARIVATAREPLDDLVARGAVDAELARWLGRPALRLPPLRERPEDLPNLALRALDRACRAFGRAPMGLDQSALDRLAAYSFPGNLRELEWILEGAVAGAEGELITAHDLARAMPSASTQAVDPFDGDWNAIEARALEAALARAGGNKSEAARALGLKRTTFLDKLRRRGVDA